MLQAIIFDFDGVIADTEKLHLRAFQETLAARGCDLSAREYYDRCLGLDDAGVLRALAGARGVAWNDEAVHAMLREKAARYAGLIAAGDVLFEGVEERVRAWSGQVPLAIATGSLRSEIDAILARRRLLGCFQAIVAAEDVTRGKPAPDGYITALERLNHAPAPADRIQPPRVVAIEDSLPGIEAARAAGLRTVAVATNQPAAALRSAHLVVGAIAALTLPALSHLAS